MKFCGLWGTKWLEFSVLWLVGNKVAGIFGFVAYGEQKNTAGEPHGFLRYIMKNLLII